jgi:hypothetical protein
VSGNYVNGTGVISVGAGASLTEIAGTETSPGVRSGWKHEISGGTVTMKENYSIGTSENVLSLTVTGSGRLEVASGKVLKITNGGQLKLDAFSNISTAASQGKLALNTGITSTDSPAAAAAGTTGKVTVGTTDYVVKYRGDISGLSATTLTP